MDKPAKNVYLWRDRVDPNQFWIGIKSGSKYYAWLPVFCAVIHRSARNDSDRTDYLRWQH